MDHHPPRLQLARWKGERSLSSGSHTEVDSMSACGSRPQGARQSTTDGTAPGTKATRVSTRRSWRCSIGYPHPPVSCEPVAVSTAMSRPPSLLVSDRSVRDLTQEAVLHLRHLGVVCPSEPRLEVAG